VEPEGGEGVLTGERWRRVWRSISGTSQSVLFRPHSAVNVTVNPVTFLIARLPKLPSGLRLGLIAVFLTVSGKDYLVLRGRMHITPTGPGQHRLLNTPRG